MIRVINQFFRYLPVHLLFLVFALSAQAQTAKSEPRAVDDMRSGIAQTSAIVEGVVSSVRESFDVNQGPWTEVTFSDVTSHFGEAPRELTIRQFGGPLPNGRVMVISELPVFEEGGRYLVFLRNTSWNLSPVVGPLAFRLHTVDGRAVLTTQEGNAVTSLDAGGIGVGPKLTEGSAERVFGLSSRPPVEAPAVFGADFSNQDSAVEGPGKLLGVPEFVGSLKTAMRDLGTGVSGSLESKPAGNFSWRGLLVQRSPKDLVPVVGQGGSSSEPEIDRSDPQGGK